MTFKTPLFLTTLYQTWKEFALETTLHGVKYAVGRRRLDRWIWSLVPMMSTGAACYMVVIMYNSYFAEPTRALYENQQAPIGDFPFPGISICSPRKFTKRNIATFMRKIKLPENITRARVEAMIPSLLGFTIPLESENQEELHVLDRVFAANDYTPQDVLKILTPLCRKFLVNCRWQGKEVACTDLFKRAKTKDGYCCSFNYNTDFNEPSYTAVHTKYFGPAMGLSVVLDTLGMYDKQVYHVMDSFKLMVHNSQSFAGRFTTEIIMPLFSEVSVGLSPLQIKIGPQAIILSPENRKCYADYEIKLPHFYVYRKSDCLVECEISKSIELCGCQPFMYPREERDTICNASQIVCLAKHLRNVQSVNWESNCECPPQCSENSTDLTVDTTDLSGKLFNVDTFYSSLTSNQTLVHFFMAKQFGTIVKKAVVTYWVDLISQFGGVFNLFLGCSLLSLVEVAYHFLLKLPVAYYRQLKKSKVAQVKVLK